MTGALELYLVRHTETDWNRDARYLGRSDRPLTPRGARRAAAIARRIAALSPDCVWTSGLRRTRFLARAAVERGAPRPRHDRRWAEVDHGRWEGLTWSEVAARFPLAARRRYEDPWRSRAHGGESVAALWRRVRAALRDLRARQPQGRAVVVTHAGPVQLLVCHALGAPLDRWSRVRVDCGGVSRIDLWPDGGCALARLNEGTP